jgi:hypothetical protein
MMNINAIPTRPPIMAGSAVDPVVELVSSLFTASINDININRKQITA